MNNPWNANYYINLGSDSAMIQAAVDAAAALGEEAVIPALNARTGERIWNIDQTIFLSSDCSIALVNAHLRMADEAICRMFQNKNALTPLGKTLEGRQKNISIRGIGTSTLDGGIYNGVCDKTKEIPGIPLAIDNMMMYFHNVENIHIENLSITDQRFWSTCFMYCSDVVVRNITFQSHCNVPNQDGIDIHVGCHNFLVENIRGCTGDDVVAMTTADWDIMHDAKVEGLSPDIHDIIIRNLNVYAANGCALVRLLNHDGHKLYNVLIDGLIESSPWSENDAPVAANPDLEGYIDVNYRFVMPRKQTLGEFGYRSDSAIRIGENFWYGNYPANPGDTWGITIRNVSTHARHAVTICNTLYDSTIENIRLFGNGFRGVFFNNGDMRNITFRDMNWTTESRPHPEDRQFDIEWNDTHSRGLSAIYFSGTVARGLKFENVTTGYGLESVFGGYGDVELMAEKISSMDENTVLLEGEYGCAEEEKRYKISMAHTEPHPKRREQLLEF